MNSKSEKKKKTQRNGLGSELWSMLDRRSVALGIGIGFGIGGINVTLEIKTTSVIRQTKGNKEDTGKGPIRRRDGAWEPD